MVQRGHCTLLCILWAKLHCEQLQYKWVHHDVAELCSCYQVGCTHLSHIFCIVMTCTMLLLLLLQELHSSERIVRGRLEALRESNPMMGLRGCRLGVAHPEISHIQVRGGRGEREVQCVRKNH